MDESSLIPQNTPFCYTINGFGADGKIIIKACPHHSIDTTKPSQNNGHCSYLNRGDWETEGFSLLWDMVKECGISND